MNESQLLELELSGTLGKEAAELIRKVISSPFYDGYLAVLCTVNNLNKELKDGASTIDGQEEKGFERVHKYILDITEYYDKLDYFRGKLTPSQVRKAEVEAHTLLDQARLNVKKNQTREV